MKAKKRLKLEKKAKVMLMDSMISNEQLKLFDTEEDNMLLSITSDNERRPYAVAADSVNGTTWCISLEEAIDLVIKHLLR